jgi:hypothetical protein
MKANLWHTAGLRGAGVKIGLIDSFSQAAWNTAQASGDVPAPAGTFCRVNGSSCSIMAGGTHGVSVAEAVIDMAPSATLYLASVLTASDLQAAVDYFHGQGVKIISRSQTSPYDGPGDGTGPIATVVSNAVADGMTWFNAAGNSAGVSGTRLGSYWRGSWADADANGWLDFAPGDESLGIACHPNGGLFVNGFRWNDWGANRTDYDVYVTDANGTTVASSTLVQQSGAAPIENLSSVPCPAGGAVFLFVKLFAAGNGTAGDTLEFMVNGTGLEYWQNPFSAAAPMVDSASSGMLAVGAIDPLAGTTIASYSSWGPTNDGRVKPDLSAASCFSGTTSAPGCFNGTSAATPAAAGAGALVLGAGLASTPAQLKTYLMSSTVDRGAAGTDNTYGKGELILPNPPATGVKVSSGSCTAKEAGSCTFVVTLSQAAASTVTVGYATQAGTATAADYTTRSGTLSFSAGTTSRSINVALTDDDLTEPNETFTLALSNPVGATLNGNGTGTIQDGTVVVTAGFSTGEASTIAQSSTYYGESGDSLRFGGRVIRFFDLLAAPGGLAPWSPAPTSSGPVTLTARYTQAEAALMQDLANRLGVTLAQVHIGGVRFVNLFWYIDTQ